jgi:arsenate reductase
MEYTIYHNPRCSKSRATLALLEEAGVQTRIVPYLKEPPAAGTIERLAAHLKCRPSDLIRRNDPDYRAGAAEIERMDDAETARWLAGHPAALQRPIVVREDGAAVIGRPPESVAGIIAR